MADDIAIVRSMVTEQINHDPAHTFMNTGTAISGRPSMGSWVNYGLGSEAEDLPGFRGHDQRGRTQPPAIASRQWRARASCRAAFRSGIQCHRRSQVLPAQPRGREPRSEQRKLVAPLPPWTGTATRRSGIETDTRIAAYVCFPVAGLGARTDGHLRGNLGLCSRHVWRQTGGRFLRIELSACPQTGGKRSPLRSSVPPRMGPSRRSAKVHGHLLRTDRQTHLGSDSGPQAAGMLEDTLVIWGGEFGRTPMFQGKGPGRDHHVKGFCGWPGGGVKGGIGYGGNRRTWLSRGQGQGHVRDMHATMLHLLGINHQFFTVKHQDWIGS